jgi:hypothetical protein
MTQVRNSFFGANAVDEGDDLKMAASVIHGDSADGAAINVKDLTIRLRVHDGETKEKYVVEIAETEAWDWKDPGVWRVINGWQVNSYGTLVSLLQQKQQNGVEEVEMLVAPRFSMLSGG